MSEALIARQSIFDGDLNVVAYELLFRSHHEATEATFDDGELATINVIRHCFDEIGLHHITGGLPAFINFTRKLILEYQENWLPKDSVVIELLEDITVDEQLIKQVKKLVAQGYQLALDDFLYTQAAKPLLEYAQIIKIDVMNLSPQEIERQFNLVSSYPAKLLAEKVETYEQFEQCKALGFHYFQGYFLAKPNLVTKKTPKNDSWSLLDVIINIQQPHLSVAAIEQALAHHAVSTYNILKAINLGRCRGTRKITNLDEASILLGLHELKAWMIVLLLRQISKKPKALLLDTMSRAKMCELLKPSSSTETKDDFFAVGLLSNVDALLDKDMKTVLAKIVIKPTIQQALLNEPGELAAVLNAVVHYQRGNWAEINWNEFESETLSEAYLASIEWANKLAHLLKH